MIIDNQIDVDQKVSEYFFLTAKSAFNYFIEGFLQARLTHLAKL
jgi:hypothetical protein